MSNISTAKSSLSAELAHVQSGLAYYQARVEALTAAIDQLDAIGDEDDADLDLEEVTQQKKSRRGRKPGKAAASRASAATSAGAAKKTGKRAGRKGRGETRMPSTGGDFFPNLITEQRQSMTDLLNAAASQLPFKPTAEENRQLRSRLVAAVNQMLKAGKVQDEGKGRARVYFRA
ncbi:hypothetical protein EDC30_105272 [Paucimonas lemoignei]|uniref:Uncharacterized protein n=1 Tax=Paucimonas lemoignei TaxID=29443 RepID=A0A4R3HZU7_PAULE|nr:hypothetical protein [Paucimonas lemoignei]TCS37049.1 hypothetical protein EDC30_105272 [Paucimonas lemoignei]